MKYNQILWDIPNNTFFNVQSIFENLTLKTEQATSQYFYDAVALNTCQKEDFFPKKQGFLSFDRTLFDKEKACIDGLKSDILYEYTSYYLAYKHFARVAAAQHSVESIFDSNRINAAKQAILDKYPQNEEYLLVKGDFAGVQKFIYSNIDTSETGNTKGLSKRLRGKSFYVSMIADMVAEEFVGSLGLQQANIIYSGGGHFILLVQKNAAEKLKAISQKVNEFLLEKVSNAFNFILATVPCQKDIFENTAAYMSELNYALSGEKYKPHQQNLRKVFAPQKDIDFDAISIGNKLPKIKFILDIKLANNWTETQKEEGQALRKENNVVLDFSKFRRLLVMVEKVDETILSAIADNYGNVIDELKIIAINQTDFLEKCEGIVTECRKKKIKVGFGFRYIGNYAPLERSDKVMEFGDLIKRNATAKIAMPNLMRQTVYTENAFQAWEIYPQESENAHLAFPKLTVMRLDVDNLGSLFGFGLGEKASFVKTATLSRELHLFFAGYFTHLAEKWQIYVTYSGGDDAFVVGSWINVVHFAQELYHKFREFVCENEQVTFSAGVFMCDEHYPVAKFADKAAEEEKKAKNFPAIEDNKIKNAISIFDHTLSFAHFDAMVNFSVKLLSYTKGDNDAKDTSKIARSMVHRILGIIKSCIDKEGKLNLQKLNRQTAQLHYLFARHGFNATEINKKEKAKAITQDIMEVLLRHFKNIRDLVPNFLIPTHYVVLLTRKEK